MTIIKTSIYFFAFMLCNCAAVNAQRQKVWLDADTGNETDDVYAIVRLINDNTVNVVGLSSAHFNNADLLRYPKWNQYNTKGINTVKISQRLNQELLKLNHKITIPHPLGADRQTGRAWGNNQARVSAASNQIIAEVKKLSDKEKLDVLCLGALTNIASAVATDTSIARHINVYLLGAKYNNTDGYWDKNEFNIRNDLNAFDYLLNNPLVDLIIMPVTTAAPFKFQRDSLYQKLHKQYPVQAYLKKRWQQTNPDDTIRTLWDLALAEAYLLPRYAVLKTVTTPLENTRRPVMVYVSVDNNMLRADFFDFINQLKQ